MIELQASVNKTVLTISDVPKIASGSKNYVSVRFQFDSEWSSIQPVMVCYRDIKAPFYNEIIGGTAKIPHEVLRDPGPICIGVFGISGSTRITSTVCRIIIQQGAISQNIQQSDPSNDIWSQIMNQYQEIKDLCKNIIATSEEAAKKAQGFADNASYSATVASQQQQMASKHASTASEAATKCEEGVQKALTAAVTAQNAKDAAQSASNTAKSSATSAKAYAERAERATTGIETALSQANAAAQNAQEAKSAAQAASQEATKAADDAEAAKEASLIAQVEVNRGIADAMAAANKAEQAVGNIGSSVQQAQDAAKSASDSARAAALSKQGIETAEASAKESAKQAAASKTAVEQSATQASEAAARAQQSQAAAAESATQVQAGVAEATKQATAAEGSATKAEKAAEDAIASASRAEAMIDDSVVKPDKTWSSKHLIDMSHPEVVKSGNPVVCNPVAGYPLGITASWEPIQEGEGAPSPDNIRPIIGWEHVMAHRSGTNLIGLPDTTTNQYNELLKLTPEQLDQFNALPRGVPLYFYADIADFTNGELVCVGTAGILGYIRKNGSGKLNRGKITQVRLVGGASTAGERVYKNIMVGLSGRMPYRPYIGTTNTMTLPKTIYGGEVDIVSGDGVETWDQAVITKVNAVKELGTVVRASVTLPSQSKIAKTGNAISNYLPEVVAFVSDTESFYTNQSVCYIKLAKSRLNEASLAGVNEYLASHPLQVVYRLSEQASFNGTGVAEIQAIDGANTILTNADVMTVKCRNAKSYTDSAIDKLAIRETASGNPAVIRDSADWQMEGLRVYGQSEQVTTTGANLLDCSNTMSNVGNTEVTLSGNLLTIINQNAYPAVVDIPITLDAGTYYMSVLSASVPVPIYRDGAWFSNGVSDNSKKSTIKIMDGGLYVCRITAEAQSTATVNELMISAKDVPYEPYTGGKPAPSPEYPQEIVSREVSSVVVTGSNLLPPDDYFETATNKYFCKNTGLLLRAGVKYVFSCDGGPTNLYVNNKTTGETVVKAYNKSEAPYTPSEDGLYYFMIYHENGVSGFNNFRLNVGLKMPYEPYHAKIVKLSIPVTLRGVPVTTGGTVTIDGKQYISDVIVDKNGVIGVKRRTMTTKLAVAAMNASERLPGWQKTGLVDKMLNPVQYIFCSHLHRNQVSINYVGDVVFLERTEMTQTEWKQKYPDLIMDFVFPLKEPTFEPLPESDQRAIRALRTYHGNTVVTTGAHTEVDYVADPKLYIDGVVGTINEIKSKIIELESKV